MTSVMAQTKVSHFRRNVAIGIIVVVVIITLLVAVDFGLILSVNISGHTYMDLDQSNIFTSSAYGGVYSYQWYLNSVAVTGATSSAWSFTPYSVGSYTVYLMVTNILGMKVTSNTLSVTVNPTLTSPSISDSFGTIVWSQSSSLTSTSVGTGTPPYAYQWFSESPSATTYTAINGATSAGYTFLASSSSATGTWSFNLQVTDATGAIVTSNSVSVAVSQNTINVVSGSFAVSPGSSGSVYYSFSVYPGATAKLQGSFTASGGSGNDIKVYVADQTQTYYNSGQVHSGNIDISLQSGTYYIEFDNSFSIISTKTVSAQINLIYS
jgi:hypothetical protein